jgi:dynein heavy chain
MIADWIDEIERFKKMCISLPKDLKTWQAYTELKVKIESYKEVLPIISELKKPSIKDRHWLKVVEVTGDQIPFD